MTSTDYLHCMADSHLRCFTQSEISPRNVFSHFIESAQGAPGPVHAFVRF